MEEEYEMKLELGLTNSSGEHIDWNIWACVIVHKDDNGVFSFDLKWFKDIEFKHYPSSFNNHIIGMSKPIIDMMRIEAGVKFQELLKADKDDN